MIVVDTSFVIQLLLLPDRVPSLQDLRSQWHAPSVLDVEVVSAVRGHLLSRQVSAEQAAAVLDDYAGLGVRIWPLDVPLRRRMLQLAHNVSAYDGAFVALAEALDAPLVTRDKGMAVAAPRSVRCVLL